MDSKLYLAENVLNERRTVTYRSLSRALKVHAHLAKQILFEFYRSENAKKPHSVHATYLISGIQKPPEPTEDEIMQSSPYLPSSAPNQEASSDSVRTMSIILTSEEDLEDAKSTFHSISTIHVYSVQPTVLQDLNVLTDVGHEDSSAHAHEDPLEYGKQWGMIQNTNVKRRTRALPPPPAATKASVPPTRTLQKDAAQAKSETKKVVEPISKPSSPANSQSSSSKPAAKPAPVKREKNNLFNSFAKAKPKQPKAVSTTTESAEPGGAEDVVLDDGSEDEPEELFPESRDKTTSEHRESRKEKEEKLRKMMEDVDPDDEEMPDAEEEQPREPTPIEEPPEPAELKEEAAVHGGRRRGKRQVMKKRMLKDEEGYLVTKEEPVWESFSEDEPEPAPPKKKPAVNVAKGKPGKAGQGNIMSFFGKK